jgi:hypothetical protein
MDRKDIEEAHEMLNDALADRIVGILNELLALDYDAIVGVVFGSYVPCNKAFADHPTVQVREVELGKYGVRAIGVINGFVDTCYGRIGGEFEYKCPVHGAQNTAKAKNNGGLCPQIVELSEAQGGGEACCDEELEYRLVCFSRVPADGHQVPRQRVRGQ